MNPILIKVGRIYTNGNTTKRKVLEMGCTVKHWDAMGTISNTGVKFLKVAGMYKGSEETIPLKSFAQWAKRVVTDEA